MNFTELQISQWRQFGNVHLRFHPRVTIITGANGAGKSTLLRILSQHFGWASVMLGTPIWSLDGSLEYLYRRRRSDNHGHLPIGHLIYDNLVKTDINVPAGGGAAYNIWFNHQQQVDGLFIGSHRPVQSYQPVSSIPTTSISAQQAYQQYYQEVQQRFNNAYTQYSPAYRMKEAIMSMATFGPGNSNMPGNPELERVFREFEATLRVVLPKSLGFLKLEVRIPDVVMVTDSGDFVIDAASGGIMSLIDLAWQIFLYSRGKSEFTVILDEPENHLHPSMQRSIVQSLVSAFPSAQFVIATHSPFVVSSVRDASVYVLHYGASEHGRERFVDSLLLDQFTRAGTASEILREALGVPVTMPMWAEDELRQIAAEYTTGELNDEVISALRQRLDAAGLSEFYPEALSQIARRG